MIMEKSFRQKLLAYLGTAAITLTAGSMVVAGPDLTMIPERIVEDFLHDVDGEGWNDEDLATFYWMLADDPRKNIRRSTAALFAKIKFGSMSINLEPVLLKFAGDPDAMVRNALAPGLALWLSRLDTLHRTNVIVEWAISDDDSVRQTIARTLSYDVDAFGVDSVIEHLANDENEAVRAEIVGAAEKHFTDNPAFYTKILNHLS